MYRSEDADDDGSVNEDIRSKKSEHSQQQQLVHLLEENETLRSSVVALRSDFKSMQRQLTTADDHNGTTVIIDNGSISSDDNSRVSHCLRRIEDVKAQATEKVEESRMAVVANGGRKEVKKEEDESYRQCIMDLICENERLCKCWRLCFLFLKPAPPPGVLGSTVSNLSYILMLCRVLGSLLSAPYLVAWYSHLTRDVLFRRHCPQLILTETLNTRF